MSGGCPFMHGDPADPATGADEPRSPTKVRLDGDDGGMPTESILGFATVPGSAFLTGTKTPTSERDGPPCHYSSYLAVGELLSLQAGAANSKPGGKGMMHHEENCFVIVHQVQELWFKLMAVDLTKGRELLTDLYKVTPAEFHRRVADSLHFLRRAEVLFQHITDSFSVIETMHPSDFLEFRDYLIPASGFQSVSFRMLEQLLGISNIGRAKVNGQEVFTYLTDVEQESLRVKSREKTLNQVVVHNLAMLNVPANFPAVFLATVRKVAEIQQYDIAGVPRGDDRAAVLIESSVQTAAQMLEDPIAYCEGLHIATDEEAAEFKQAVLAALFAVCYRHHSRYAILASLLDGLVAVEEGMLLWRGRHLHMAERMIGRRIGSGGSSGVGYLDITRKYRIFHALWLVRKLAVRSSALPATNDIEPGFDNSPLFKKAA